MKTKTLPNTYIPIISPKSQAKSLIRLPLLSLCRLSQLWTKLGRTKPVLSEEDKQQRITQTELNKLVFDEIETLKQKNAAKRKIVDRILVQYWSVGLNLLQLSQVDCQLIVDRPNAYMWTSSTAMDTKGEQSVISLKPQKFLEDLSNDLSKIYWNHVYICRHPYYPLIIIRIQVFDLQTDTQILRSKNRKPHIISQPAFFMAIPSNSPHIIHTPINNINSAVASLILQTVERNISTSFKQIRLATSREKPILSLEAMHIFKGISRFSKSLGAWTPYADGAVDISPLGEPETHSVVTNKRTREQIENAPQETEDEIRAKVARLKFKGSLEATRSERFFDDVKLNKKRKLNSEQELNEDDYEMVNNVDKNEFSSIAPIQYVEFTCKDSNDIPQDLTEVTIKLSGHDVFGGLFELATKGILDPTKTPGWLIGEEGGNSGIIENGVFKNMYNNGN